MLENKLALILNWRFGDQTSFSWFAFARWHEFHKIDDHEIPEKSSRFGVCTIPINVTLYVTL